MKVQLEKSEERANLYERKAEALKAALEDEHQNLIDTLDTETQEKYHKEFQ